MGMIKRGRTKKSQAYSLIAILLAIPIFIFITQYMISSQTTRTDIAEKIIADQIVQLESSIEDDISKALDICGKRALLTAVDYITINGFYLDNSTFRLKELMENGKINDTESRLMVNNTLPDWENSILKTPTNFFVKLNHTHIEIKNHNGFELNVSVFANITVSDRLDTARIKKENLLKEVKIPIEGVEDPVYTLNSEGFVRRTVMKSPYPYTAIILVNGTSSKGFCEGPVTFNSSNPNPDEILVINNASGISGFKGVVGETNNVPSDNVDCYVIGADNAVDIINNSVNAVGYYEIYIDNSTSCPLAVWHLPINLDIENGYYRSGDGPNFLMRLEGNLSNSTDGFGIESFVNIEELRSQGIEICDDCSVVDYLYFTKSNINTCNVRGLPDWFRIDGYHAAKYNLTELLYNC
jgi:hypothetical protein